MKGILFSALLTYICIMYILLSYIICILNNSILSVIYVVLLQLLKVESESCLMKWTAARVYKFSWWCRQFAVVLQSHTMVHHATTQCLPVLQPPGGHSAQIPLICLTWLMVHRSVECSTIQALLPWQPLKLRSAVQSRHRSRGEWSSNTQSHGVTE